MIFFHNQAVESSSMFCLKMNSEIGFDFDNVVDQWNKKFNSGTNVVLGKYILYLS